MATLHILRSACVYIKIYCVSLTRRGVVLVQSIQIWILSCIGLMEIFKINFVLSISNNICNSLLQTNICRGMHSCNPFCTLQSMYPIVIKYCFNGSHLSCFISLWIRSWLQIAAFLVWLGFFSFFFFERWQTQNVSQVHHPLLLASELVCWSCKLMLKNPSIACNMQLPLSSSILSSLFPFHKW